MPAKIAEFDFAAAAAFAPTSNQRRLINAIHEDPSVRTIRDFCEHCDISRSTYYNWCKNPAFRLWFATAWSARLFTEGVTMINQARAKSSYMFPYWRALAELTFDPRGLALLQMWQLPMFTLDGAAFECGVEAAPGYDHRADPTSDSNDDPSLKQASSGKLPPLAPVADQAENWTLRAPCATAKCSAPAVPSPVAVARLFRRALTPARRHRATAQPVAPNRQR